MGINNVIVVYVVRGFFCTEAVECFAHHTLLRVQMEHRQGQLIVKPFGFWMFVGIPQG